MMVSRAAAILIFVVIITAGCTGKSIDVTSRGMSIAGQVAEIKSEYRLVKAIISEKSDEFGPDEIDALQDFDYLVGIIIARLEGMRDADSIDMHDVAALYSLAMDGYSKARQVVAAHGDVFSDRQLDELKSFDSEAADVAARVEYLLDDPSRERVIRAIELIPTVLQVGLKLIAMTM